MGPEVMDYGMREFAVQDPNGYYLAFREPDLMRTRLLAEQVPLVREFSERVLPWFDGSGAVHPVIGAVFPFTGIAGAHAALEEDTNFGKVVPTWG